MGKAKPPKKIKLIVGFIYADEKILSKAEAILLKKFGSIDMRSPIFPFAHTEYYESEMGVNLKKKFMSFSRLISPEKAWRIKLFTNKIESKFSKNNKRIINIDPGYITLGKLVLFTTKNYTHRLYLGNGIFGEVTLSFKNGTFAPHDYTYPDYSTKEYINFLNSVRNTYKRQLSP